MKSKQKNESQNPNVCLMAAALQEHMLRDRKIHSLNFPVKRLSSVKHSMKEGKTVSRALESRTPSITLPKLVKRATESTKFDENAQNQINRHHKSYQTRLSLAQKLKLVPAPKAPMEVKDWESVLNLAKTKNYMYENCAICLEPFRTEQQVLLDCSHVFHKHCLQTFERLEQCRSCPMCRRKDYQRIDVDEAAVTYLNKCATMIQSHFRRLQAEIAFQKMLKLTDSKVLSDFLKRKSLNFKMKQMSISTFKSMRKSKKSISKMVAANAVNPTRMADLNELMTAYISRYREIQQAKKDPDEEVNWYDVSVKFYMRKELECSICLAGFASQSKTYLLNCSHGFHVNCLNFFERYSTGAVPLCPLCRNAYEKLLITFDPKQIHSN